MKNSRFHNFIDTNRTPLNPELPYIKPCLNALQEATASRRLWLEIHILKHGWYTIDLGLRLLFFDLSKLRRVCLAGVLILT